MRLSIIVPVYNGEVYVESCIHSLCKQGISDDEYEILLVDDGSLDGTANILKNLSEKYPALIVLKQQNGGVSKARNLAIQHARGSYILPVDADDILRENCLEEVLKYVEEANHDIVVAGFSIRNNEGKEEWCTDFKDFDNQPIPGAKAYYAARGEGVRFPDRSWGIFYKRSFILEHSIVYPENVPYLEDGMFLAKAFSKARVCSYVNQQLYLHCLRMGSATQSPLLKSEQALNGFLLGVTDLKNFQKSIAIGTEAYQLLNHAIAKFALIPLMVAVNERSQSLFRNIGQKLKSQNLDKLDASGCKNDYQKYVSWYNRSPWYFGFRFLLNLYTISIKRKLGFSS